MRRAGWTLHPFCWISILIGGQLANAADEAPGVSAKAIVVRVINQAGEPQPDVAISLFGYNDDWRHWQNLERDTRSDGSGMARYEGLSSDSSYLLRCRFGRELVGYRDCVLTGEQQQHHVEVTLQRPLTTLVHVRDEAGKAVEGARIWAIVHSGANGSFSLDWQALDAMQLSDQPSNESGELRLPALPPGTLDLRLIHRDYAPCRIKGVGVGQRAAAQAKLGAGVTISLQLATDSNEPPVDSIVVDLRRNPFEDPSTLIGRLPEMRPDGAELTVAAGKYRFLRLQHPDYVVTPTYSERYGSTVADTREPFEVRSGKDTFKFHLKRKVKVRGRVINGQTGEPLAGMYVEGELPAGTVQGAFARFANEWTGIGWGETNKEGEYEVDVAAGRARVSFQGRGLVATPEYHEIEVAPDGSTRVPEFVVRPMAKVRGVVRDQHGEPVPNAVVRFRGSILTYAVEPVLADEQGRFELAPPWIPEDLQTHERLPAQSVVAFHPTEELYGQREIHLDDADSLNDIALQLERQDFDSVIERFAADLSPWQRGIVPADREAELAAISLRGKPAPELDGAHWLNTPKATMSLADFHGKYVLLNFWTTWCSPCHADMPSLRILDQLYRDKGVVVIGVHDNSMPLESIEADVAKERLAYPIVVDHPDGRILTRYKAHGVAGYPSYMLVGPDGTVLTDDDTVPGPSLRSFKIEIIRQLLLDAGSEPR
jgi:thiol-disulfide isomerase/thioredoxin/protocatechuate 3,4-dioxygenase beta subunit